MTLADIHNALADLREYYTESEQRALEKKLVDRLLSELIGERGPEATLEAIHCVYHVGASVRAA